MVTRDLDVIMNDTPGAQEFQREHAGSEDPDDIRDVRQRLRTMPGASDSAASFEFLNEDHTLGNALRYVIMKNPEVEFCGYSIPHPSDPKMNLRIQTYDDANMNVYDILDKGLDDLADLCDVVTEKFEEATRTFVPKPKEKKGSQGAREEQGSAGGQK